MFLYEFKERDPYQDWNFSMRDGQENQNENTVATSQDDLRESLLPNQSNNQNQLSKKNKLVEKVLAQINKMIKVIVCQ